MSDSHRGAGASVGLPDLVEYYKRVAEPRHDDAARLLAYWQSCMAAGGFVVGRDLPARPIAGLLQSIAMHVPLADYSDFRVRLTGSAIMRRFGGDTRGRLLSEIFPPEDFKHHLAASIEVVTTGRPIVLDSSLKRGNLEEMHTEVLLLPATSPDLKATWLIAGLFFFH
jgi:hypothetical protein